MSKGLVYFARNAAFPHLIKIGRTKKLTVEERGLDGSNIPEDFDYFLVLQCEDCESIEKKIHAHVSDSRHYAASGRKTEFFWNGCLKKAMKYAKDLKGVSVVTDKETEEMDIMIGDKKQTIKRPNTTFSMIGLKKGTKILFENDPKEWAIVKNDKNQISYKGQPQTAISNVSNKKCGRSTNGFYHFFYKGKRLFDMRPDMQE
ncbi:MAG: GIY-YIG nuclease family protein [Alphaproteobacteria bacterium]|nr:GIY-YIG nuclease family protein [Alphaproteobacteria bacterium]